MEAAEWYRLRNDRTNRIDDILLDSNAKVISVIVRKYSTLSDQAMAICTANILSRWCRRVSFYISEDIPCLFNNWKGMKLHEVIMEIMNSSDPYGEFSIKSKNDIVETDLSISIGSTTKDNEFWINSEGWVAGFGFGPTQNEIGTKSDDINIIGAIYASSVINAAAFSSYIYESKPEPFDRWISLLDFETSSQHQELKNPIVNNALNIGKIWQIGAGAVGSSFDFILSLFPVSGSIEIIDFDKVEIPNTSSSLIFTAKHAKTKTSKVEACNEALRFNNNLLVQLNPDMDYSQFMREIDLEAKYPDLILCFANEKNIWSTIQHNEPPIVLHATTSNNWGVNFGRHIPFEEWCIVCRFGIKDYEHIPVCSTSSEVGKDKQEEKLGILPFLSPIAAVLVFSEVLKLSMRETLDSPMDKNFIQLSMKNVDSSSPHSFFRKPKVNCSICSEQNESSYYTGYKKSKYYL
ncbi:ThiF family adenylyltransferase [Negadavirga shengliensis]|uniref:ThiF family adenylyltransferase n=1 Tax=Negadavirga shengliensis TaxID=1389218 RepID=A0ABV9T5X8_9BACT